MKSVHNPAQHPLSYPYLSLSKHLDINIKSQQKKQDLKTNSWTQTGQTRDSSAGSAPSPKKLKKLFILRKPAKNFAKSSKFWRNEIFAIVKFFEETSEMNFCRNSPNFKIK